LPRRINDLRTVQGLSNALHTETPRLYSLGRDLDVADLMDVIEPYLRTDPTLNQAREMIVARFEEDLKGNSDILAKAVFIVWEVTGAKD
jgi:hypothetical protein